MNVTNNTIQDVTNVTNNNAFEVFNINNNNSSESLSSFSQIEMDNNTYTTLNDKSNISHNYDVQAINILNLLFCLWMFFALLNFAVYKIKKGKNSKQKMILVIYSVCCSVFPLISTLITYSILFVEWFSTEPDNKLCKRITDSAAVFFFISMLLIYLYPWLKQRYLYQQPSMQHLNTKLVKVMSVVALVLMSLLIIFIGFVVSAPNRYQMDPKTMQFTLANNQPEWIKYGLKVAYYVAAGEVALIQLGLFVLLVRPLLEFRKNKVAKNSETGKKVVRTLKQALVSFAICSVATFMSGFLGEYVDLKENIRVSLRNAVFDIAMNVSLFSVVVSYENWWKIITFSLPRKSAGEPLVSSSSTNEKKIFSRRVSSNV